MKKHIISILFFGVGYLILSPLVVGQKFNRPNIPGPNGIQVNSFNGNIYFERQDHYLPGRGFPLNLAFSYNGLRDTLDFGYGKGWTLAYNLYYEQDSVDNIIMVSGDGRRDVFQAEEIGYIPPSGVFDFLEEYETDKLRLTTKTGVHYFFEDAVHKRLTKITDTNGNELLLTYEAGRPITLTNTAGRRLVMTWEDDRLKEVTDSSISPARKIQYAYDTNGYLTQVTDPLGKTQKYLYNKQGQIKEMTDKNGQTTSLVYNGKNVISQVCSPISMLTLKYNPENNQTFAIEDGNSGNQVTTYTFNEEGNLIRKKGNCCGFDVQYEYDEQNNIRQVTDANGSVTNYTYDRRGNLISETDALGNQTIYSYESTLNRLIGILDANGNTISNTYDEKGNLTTVAIPEGITLAYNYDQFGNMTVAIDGKGNTTSFEYDGVGNVIKTTYPSGEETYTYDNAGNMLSLTDINGNTMVFTYDALDRLTKLTDPLGNEVVYEYDGNSNLTQETDPNGNIKNYSYDALNRLQQVTTPAGMTNYTYDQLGNLTRIKDANGKVNTYTYNSLNLLASETDGVGSTTSYEYDGDGNLLARITPNGDIIEYSYDALDRLVSKKYGDNEDIFAYDALGNLATASNNAISYRYEYDGLNRLVSKAATNWQKVIRYTYDANGNRATMTDPNGGVTQYTYDADNRLTQLQNPFGETFRFIYDGAGRITRQDNWNGTYTLYTYDNADRLTELVNHDAGGGIISRHAYTYDANGNRLSMDTEEGTHTYTYDGDNRLLTVNYADGSTESFAYDATGNRTSKTTDGITTNYTYDGADRLLTANAITFGFDANGNLLEKNEDGQFTRYTYDTENRLVGINLPDGRTINYAYDPFGDRVSKTTPDGIETRYILDGDNVLQELDVNNTRVVQYTATEVMDSWLGMHRNGQNYTYHQDGLNSTMALSNATGNIANKYTYEAYGKIKTQTENIANPYTYTGRELDPIADLYYYRTRYYEAGIGRFIVKDFFQGLMERPMSINKYGYVEGNPILYNDPNGELIFLAAIPALLKAAAIGGVVSAGLDFSIQYFSNGRNIDCVKFSGVAKSALIGFITLGSLGSVSNGFKIGAILSYRKDFLINRNTIKYYKNQLRKYDNKALTRNEFENFKEFQNSLFEAYKNRTILQKEVLKTGAIGGIGAAYETNEISNTLLEDCNKGQGYQEENEKFIQDGIDFAIFILRAIDPNDILGPSGYGSEKWVSINENLNYTIRFENDPDFATAAARNVFIDMPINVNADRGSFRVGNYGFGNFLYETPDNRSYFESRLDVSDSLGVLVNYTSGLDVTNEKGFWVFNSVDPITRLEPTDARLGFLPVNDTAIGNGEGFVNFTMRANRDVVTGDTLFAQASIVFDEEAPMITNRHFNTIDADLPISEITFIRSVGNAFEVSLNSTDVGSGLQKTTLYVSENNRPLQLVAETFLSDTTISFAALEDSTYCFVSIAEDNVGNMEAAKPLSQYCLQLGDSTNGAIPFLASFSPQEGSIGDTITLIGENLDMVNDISLNGTTASFTLLNSETIIVKVPEGATTGKINLTYEGGQIVSTEDFTITEVTSLADNVNYQFTIFPNPSSGIFILESDYLETQDLSFEVYSLSGKKINKGKLSQDLPQIDISGSPSGVYFIHFFTETGKYVSKVVKRL